MQDKNEKKSKKSKNSQDLDVRLLKEFKNSYLALKQGEAIERISTPRTHDESISLGNYGHQAAYAISCIDLHQKLIHQLTDFEGNALTKFTETVSRSSGSIGFVRAKLSLDAIKEIGQYIPTKPGFTPHGVEEDKV